VNPFSNLQPISLTRILEVTPGDALIPQGDTVLLLCTVKGMNGHEVFVEIDPNDTRMTRTSLGRIRTGEEEKFARKVPKVTTGFRYRFLAGDASPSEWQTVTPRPPTAFTDIQLTITPPAYMGIPARTLAALDTRIEIPQGSTVAVVTDCNTGLGKLDVDFGGETVSFTSQKGALRWKGQLAVTKGQYLSLYAEDLYGVPLVERLPFSLLSDSRPVIELKEPQGKTVLPPGATPRISFRVTDDFGLQSVVMQQEVVSSDGTKTWVERERWTLEGQTSIQQVWQGSGDSTQGGKLIYRIVVEDNRAPKANIAVSPSARFEAHTMAESRKERKQLEDKAEASVNQIVVWQRENLRETRKLIEVARQAERGQWSELAERQRKIRSLTRELLDNPLKPLGNLSKTVQKLYLNEMMMAVDSLSKIPEIAPDERVAAANSAWQLENSILRQLTVANEAVAQAKVDRRVSGISAMLAKMVRDQEDVQKTSARIVKDMGEVHPSLVDAQDRLAGDLSEFTQSCVAESAEVRANDAAFADVMMQISEHSEKEKVRNDMVMAAEKLDQNQAAAALPHGANALRKLKALQALLDGMKIQQELEEHDDYQEALGQAKEKITRIKDLHKKLVGFMEQVKDQKDVSEEEAEMMQEAYQKLLKNSKEALLEVPTDLHIFMDLNAANELVEDVFSMYQELEQVAGSEDWTKEDVIEEALYKEEVMLEMMEEAEGRIDDMEIWLTDTPDMKKITTEAFDQEEMPEAMALGALPTELMDIITDLKEQDEETAKEADDSATNHGMGDLEVGGAVMEGDISSFAAKGVSGGERPDHKEQDGRSGVGRQGMSNGETAAASGTINEGDNDIEARRTTDPTQGGQVDLDGEADTVATGGGKLASGKADGLGMGGGVKRMDSNEEGSWEGMAALLANKTDSLYAKASMKNIRVESLKTAAHHLRQSADAVASGNIAQVRELRKLAVGALLEAQTDLQAGPTPAYESGGTRSVLGGMVESSSDTAPAQYRDQVNEYFKVLNDVL